ISRRRIRFCLPRHSSRLRDARGAQMSQAQIYNVSHLLAGMMLVASFALLYQDRIFAVLNIFAAQAILLAMAVGWDAWTQQRPHLFITAALALGLKGIIIPVALHKMIVRLGV